MKPRKKPWKEFPAVWLADAIRSQQTQKILVNCCGQLAFSLPYRKAFLEVKNPYLYLEWECQKGSGRTRPAFLLYCSIEFSRGIQRDFMVNNIRTVSDTKRDFYTHHTRPINSIYRRVVEELMVEMHLLAVNADFRYDPIYALGMVTSFDKFMQGYRPEQDKDSIFAALCQAVGGDAPKYRHDSKQLQDLAARLSGQEIIAWLSQSTTIDDVGELQQSLRAIADNPNFKYSRLFAIGLFTLLELADSDLVKDEKQRNEVFQQISEPLHLPNEKLQKDLEIYLGNLEKMAQVRVIMEDTLIAERKKRDQRTQDAGIEVVPTKDGD